MPTSKEKIAQIRSSHHSGTSVEHIAEAEGLAPRNVRLILGIEQKEDRQKRRVGRREQVELLKGVPTLSDKEAKECRNCPQDSERERFLTGRIYEIGKRIQEHNARLKLDEECHVASEQA